MARTDGSDSYLYRRGSSPETRVAISQKNRVFSKPYTVGAPSEKQVGVLATFDYNESRSVDPVRGVGFGDKIAELVPGVTEPMSMTLNRALMYTQGIVQELGYKGGVDGIVRSLRHHKWPFDIRSELVFSELVSKIDGEAGMIPIQRDETDVGDNKIHFAMVTQFVACWLESYSVSYPSDSAIIMEDASAKATDVTDGSSWFGNSADTYGDFLESGNNPLLKSGSGSRLFA
jgi:hypothetical protein